MRTRNVFAFLVTAAALLGPGVYLQAADTGTRSSDETVGEKMDDASITTKVKMKLLGNKATSALNTSVETTDGVVTLTGKARSQAEKELASKLTEEVKGVKSVVNEMKIEESDAPKSK
ncbi:BON domain-containing protein [Geobacter sp. DSM 9736]|uniref:BON domain-containing protein n=1 Tax=Geobacter sp. DSM 9736 TaxID=1277350 RepID=UPI000B513F22|nr:BON domain-containing protein [Geobacter sp. DSM 9736]SNB48021.1 BON domain-containing protein [Geobacter sp. DSM 9736]